ncbi:DUF6343 family protein [Streptomyces sp. NBC_00557]|uniref:DUF6343 family protein n=1 Tax=Streptomyces sp. NBC_00557 TaxID=2975776 RepID=UPI002E803F78|nr:DUF6343 family protein [Streptomyces sp. NBC_00557]WUC33164.1 DUF6343 family protein [Streptomyces sp. NBC_00557]
MRDERHGRTAVPESRSRPGAFGHRFPRTGTEPATARSALRLRRLLSAVFLPVFAAATAGFALWASRSGPGDSPGSGPLTVLAAVCGVLALGAALDLVIVSRRRRRERQERG